MPDRNHDDRGLYPPVRPARIFGEVPQEYGGPIAYRTIRNPDWKKRPVRAGGEYFSIGKVRLGDQIVDAGALFARQDKQCVGLGKAPELLDESGRIHGYLAGPIPSKVKAAAPRTWSELNGQWVQFISARVRDAIEHAEPDVHHFIPLDFVSDRGDFRAYVLFAGHAAKRGAIAPKASGIEIRSFYSDGAPNIATPNKFGDPGFVFLNSQIVNPEWHAFLIPENLYPIFSQEIISVLGDILPEYLAFAPCGFVHEPYGDL